MKWVLSASGNKLNMEVTATAANQRPATQTELLHRRQ